jgi:hypothetical protein
MNLFDRKTSEKHAYRQVIRLIQSELVSLKAENAKEENREGQNSRGREEGEGKREGSKGRGPARASIKLKNMQRGCGKHEGGWK